MKKHRANTARQRVLLFAMRFTPLFEVAEQFNSRMLQVTERLPIPNVMPTDIICHKNGAITGVYNGKKMTFNYNENN